MTERTSRPAHRPSRRSTIIEVGTRLFATTAFDEVTVGDIAEQADMTAAAVYYHFTGKEQILFEAVREFGDELLGRARELAGSESDPGAMVVALLDHVRRRRHPAKLFFVASAGLHPAVDEYRSELRVDLADRLGNVARRSRPTMPPAELAVVGVTLVSIVEVAASSLLQRDATFQTIGARSFPEAIAELVHRIVGDDLAGLRAAPERSSRS